MDSGIIIGIAAVAAVLALIWAVSRGKGRGEHGSDNYHDGGGAYAMAADASDDSSSCDSGDSSGGDCGGGDGGGGD